MMRVLAAVAALLAVLLTAGCGGSGHAYPDPSCPAVLGQLSSVPPEGARMINDQIQDLQDRVTPGTKLGALTNRVVADLGSLADALGGPLGPVRTAQAKYLSDVAQVQHYCDH
jgi:hypothetical protein